MATSFMRGGKKEISTPLEALSHRIKEVITNTIELVDYPPKMGPQLSTDIEVVEVTVGSTVFKVRRVFLCTNAYQVGWVVDSDLQQCMCCEQNFNWMRFRHHCRACGSLVCKSCSASRMDIPEFDDSGDSRVCNNCFTIHSHGIKIPITRPPGTKENNQSITPFKPVERKLGYNSHRLSFDKVKAIDEDDGGNKIVRENVQSHTQLQEIVALERSEVEQSLACEKAFKVQRGLIPFDLYKLSMQSLVEQRVPEAIAQRIMQNKILTMINMHHDDIAKIHIADLRSKYTTVGLDIVEIRSIWHWLSKRDWFDGPRDKLEWMYSIKHKLTELTFKEKKGTLSAVETRHPVYAGYESLTIFDNSDDVVIYKRHDYVVSGLSNTVLESSPLATAEKAAKGPSSPNLPTPSKPPKPSKYFRTDGLGLGLNRDNKSSRNNDFVHPYAALVSSNHDSAMKTISTPQKPPRSIGNSHSKPVVAVIKTRFSMGVVSSRKKLHDSTTDITDDADKNSSSDECDLSPVTAFLTQHKNIPNNVEVVVEAEATPAKSPRTLDVKHSEKATAQVASTSKVAAADSIITTPHNSRLLQSKQTITSATPAAAVEVRKTDSKPTLMLPDDSIEDSPVGTQMDPALSPFSNLKKLRELTEQKKLTEAESLKSMTPLVMKQTLTPSTTAVASSRTPATSAVTSATKPPIALVPTLQQQLSAKKTAMASSSSNSTVGMTPRLSKVAEEGSKNIVTAANETEEDDNDENIPPPSNNRLSKPITMKTAAAAAFDDASAGTDSKTNAVSAGLIKSNSISSVHTPNKTIMNNNNNLIVNHMATATPHQTPILNVNAKLSMSTQKRISRKSNTVDSANKKGQNIFGFDDDEDDESFNVISHKSTTCTSICQADTTCDGKNDDKIKLQTSNNNSDSAKKSANPVCAIALSAPQSLPQPLSPVDEDQDDDFIPPSSRTTSPQPRTENSNTKATSTNNCIGSSPVPPSSNTKPSTFMSRISIGGTNGSRRVSFFKPTAQQQKQNFLKHINNGEASLAKEIIKSSTIEFDACETSELLLKCSNNVESLKEDQETLLLLIDDCHADVNFRDQSEGQTALMTLFTDPILGRVLISRGGDVLAEDNNGSCALSMSFEYGKY